MHINNNYLNINAVFKIILPFLFVKAVKYTQVISTSRQTQYYLTSLGKLQILINCILIIIYCKLTLEFPGGHIDKLHYVTLYL